MEWISVEEIGSPSTEQEPELGELVTTFKSGALLPLQSALVGTPTKQCSTYLVIAHWDQCALTRISLNAIKLLYNGYSVGAIRYE